MSAVAETWMPVSGTFRTYPLAPVLWHWEEGTVIFSKGHHDPALFLAAAVEVWADEDGDDSLTLYEGNGWERLEGPIYPATWLRDLARVRQEWWANRMSPWLGDYGARYFVEPGPCWRRGAYPVTVVEP